MLKKSLGLQTVLLIIGIGLGMSLVQETTPTVKAVHTLVGILAGLTTIGSVYLAYKGKSSKLVLGSSAIAVVATFLAGVGGKYTETDYANGLLLMRASGIAALLLSIFALVSVIRSKEVK